MNDITVDFGGYPPNTGETFAADSAIREISDSSEYNPSDMIEMDLIRRFRTMTMEV
ncbi:MAG: hypothetical protein FWH14_06475 [Oscillospiraceae bacterium]|nr:hypothetical protein [Oscillospiraceae bacterium]